MKIIHRMKNSGLPAIMKLQQFIEELNQMEQKELNNPQFQVDKNSFSAMNWLKHRRKGKIEDGKFGQN